MKRILLATFAFAITLGIGLSGAQNAQASVTAVSIIGPTAPTSYGVAPTSVDITFDVSVSHTNPYCATVEVVGVNVVTQGLGTLGGGSTTQHTVTVPIPAGTPAGTYDAKVRVDEFSCGGGFSQTDREASVVVIGIPLTTDDCKKDGWMNAVDSEGNSFKNQGDCVSFVATQGSNLGAIAP